MDQQRLHSLLVSMQIAYLLHGGSAQHGQATKAIRHVANYALADKKFPRSLRPFVKIFVVAKNPMEIVTKTYAIYDAENATA